ncbi:hypothetical protein KAS24_06445 [Candidatus Bathyarchaeota archaeon]|nr:hypothetical protein [Candidatus Bathyarchaeota archaeon]
MANTKKEIVKGEEVTLEIEPGMNLLEVNKQLAQKNLQLLQEHNVKAIDIMGSIGVGKTSLIEKLVQALKQKYRITVFKGHFEGVPLPSGYGWEN